MIRIDNYLLTVLKELLEASLAMTSARLPSAKGMDRNYLKGEEGDTINAILSGCGFNIRKFLRVTLLWLFKERIRGIVTDWIDLTRLLGKQIQPV